MRTRISLNLATMRPATLDRKLYAAEAAGFRAVGLVWDEMFEEGERGVQEVLLSGLAVSDLTSLAGWMEADRASRSVAQALAEQAVALAVNLDCGVVTAVPSAAEAEPMAAARYFQELCRLARPFGVRVGLEFGKGFRQVSNLAQAWEIVELAEVENGGLVLDVFDFFHGGSSLGMLERVPGDKILLVQVSDCMELSRLEVENPQRVYPGAGVLPLEPLLAALRDKAYSGYYSLELFNDEYWQEDPVVVARDGLRAMHKHDLR